MKKIYILQRDYITPALFIPKGTEVVKLYGEHSYFARNNFYFSAVEVENTPEWFVLKEVENPLSIRQLSWETDVPESPYYFYLTDGTKVQISRESLAQLLKEFVTNFKEKQTDPVIMQKDVDHLTWIYDRMANEHGEAHCSDYMTGFRKIITKLKNSLND